MKKKKKNKDINFYKKGYTRLQIEFGLLFIILLIFIYTNFNYIVFKTLIGTKYVYTQDLNTIYNEELNIETDEYFKYFDELSIQLFIDKLNETNDDKYTELYSIGEYAEIKGIMKSEAEKSNFETLSDKTGCMTITNFSAVSKNSVMDNIENMQNCDTLIIDLRDNTGGIVNDAKAIAELFLDKDQIIYSIKTKNGQKSYISNTEKKINPEKIIILQNKYTASASEIFIMALKENLDNVEIVGTTSYGKGVGQEEHFLIKQYGVKASTMLFFTPNGNSIHNTGIEPDIVCEENPKEYVLEKLKTTG